MTSDDAFSSPRTNRDTRSGRVLGIDPGVAGGLALLVDGRCVDAADMPVREEPKSRGGIRRRVDAEGVAALLDRWQPQRAVIEQVFASPGMGVSSAFSFGHGYGVLEAALALRGIDYRPVRPSVWKRALSVPVSKNEAQDLASQLLGAEHWPLRLRSKRLPPQRPTLTRGV